MISMILGIVMTSMMTIMPLNAEKQISVEKVENKVMIGPVAGNRNLEFGVKNILEEALLEQEYELTEEAPMKLKVEIIFLDVLTTKKNVSIIQKRDEAVVIRMKGTLTLNGKKVREFIGLKLVVGDWWRMLRSIVKGMC